MSGPALLTIIGLIGLVASQSANLNAAPSTTGLIGQADSQSAPDANVPPSLPPSTAHWTVQVDGVATEMNVPPGAATNTVGQTSQPSGQLKRYIVCLKRSLKDPLDVDEEMDRHVFPEHMLADFNITPTHVWHHAVKGFAALMDEATAEALRKDSRVLAVEPDGEIKLVDVPPAPLGIQRTGVDQFPLAGINWLQQQLFPTNNVGRGWFGNVTVAVVDTGIEYKNPDLNVSPLDFYENPNIPDGSNDFTNDGDHVEDEIGHGTHVAGIIGGMGIVVWDTWRNQYVAVWGVAPGVTLCSLKVISPTSNSWTSVIGAMNYISGNPQKFDVVNVSLVNIGPAMIITTEAAVRRVVNQGIVVIAGAGNSMQDIAGPDGILGTADDVLPAALPEVMAVGGMDPDPLNSTYNQVWWDPADNAGSNFSLTSHANGLVNSYSGNAIDLVAPAVDILSTWINDPNGNPTYEYDTGTSMAAPHVAGLAALYIAANGRPTNAPGVYQLRQALIDASIPPEQWQAAHQTLDLNGHPVARLAQDSESWIPAPTILSNSLSSAGLQISFTSVPGYIYTVQYSPSLQPAANSWTDLVTLTNLVTVNPVRIINTSICGDPNVGPKVLTATVAAQGGTSGFYRIQRTSPPRIAVGPMVQNLSAAVGTTASATFYLTNTGTSALTGSASIWYGGVVTNGFFSVVSGTNFNLAAGQSQAVVVSYSPAVAETNNHCALWVHGPAGNVFATVFGSAPTGPIAAVSPTNLDCGAILLGNTGNWVLGVTNTGTGTLTGTASTVPPFSVISGGSYSLGAGQGQAVVVRYSPVAAETDSGQVTFSGGGGAALPISAVCSQTPLPSGCVAWWRGEGNVLDSVGNNNGWNSSGVTFVQGKVRQAFGLDGKTGKVSISDSPSLNPSNQLTIELWFQPATNSGTSTGNDAIVDKGSDYNSYSGLRVCQYHLGVCNNDTFNFSLPMASCSGGAWTAGNWYHLAGTWDGSTMNLYVNGAVVASQAAAGTLTDGGHNLTIGCLAFSSLYYTAGAVDEVTLYNRALTPAEVLSIYQAGSTGKANSP